MQWIRDEWAALSTTNRTIVLVVIGVLAIGVLGSFIFLGTDYSGFGDWLRSWFD